MNQRLIYSDPHDSEDTYHRREGQIISGQSKDNNSSSNSKKHTRNNDDSIFDVVELNDQNKDHKDKSDKHSLA